MASKESGAAMWRGAVGVVGALLVGVAGLANAATAQGRRHAAIVIDANSGRVLSESSADETRYPASLTKMMTLYLLFEQLEQKKLTLDSRITFSETATRVQPSKLGLQAGSSITVLEAAKALIVKSANDVAVAVAEHIAGSEQQFAVRMTETARRIGMKSTTFRNAHGLPNDQQVTTARDMATLGLRLQDDFPKYYPLFSTREVSVGPATHRTHNGLLLTYEGTDGIKTGYISSSGFNLVANVRRGDKHVLGVVFGGATASARNQTMKTLLNMALFKAATTKTRQPVVTAQAKTKPASAPPPAKAAAAVAVPTPAAVARPTAPQPAPPVVMSQPASSVPRAEPPVAVAAADDVQIAKVRAIPLAPVARRPKELATGLAAPTPTPTPTVTAPAAIPPPAPQQVATAEPAPVRVATPAPGAQRLNGPATPGQSAPGNAVHLQVGAYASKTDAEKQLALVRETGGPSVAALQAEARPAISSGKTVYRARFVGVDPTSAGAVCNELRRRQIDCLVAKPE